MSLSSFTFFPYLPTEIRLKIWHLTLPRRLVEIQMLSAYPSSSQTTLITGPSDANDSDYSDESNDPETDLLGRLDLQPLARPTLPVTFHICREARHEALSVYRPCSGATFASPRPWPCNLFHPGLDTLFVPISLYSVESSRAHVFHPGPDTLMMPISMHSQEATGTQHTHPIPALSSLAAVVAGVPGAFVLDRMSGVDAADVAEIQRLAISWADMQVKDVPSLVEALRPFRALRELSVLFFEMTEDAGRVTLMRVKRGKLRAVLVDPEESMVRGKYLERVLKGFVELVDALNDGLKEAHATGLLGVGGGRGELPKVNIKMIRLEV